MCFPGPHEESCWPQETIRSPKTYIWAPLSGLVGPSWSQVVTDMGSSWGQLGSVWAQGGTKLGQVKARVAQVGTKLPQGGPMLPQDGPKKAPSGPSQMAAQLNSLCPPIRFPPLSKTCGELQPASRWYPKFSHQTRRQGHQ